MSERQPGRKRQAKFDWPEDAQFASDVKAKKIKWLLPEVIPQGMITLVAGRPGQGKSMWSAWLASEVSRNHGGVIFSNLEDLRAEVTRPRLEAADADLERVMFWKPDVETPHGLKQLQTFITALDVKLLVIDPIAAHIRASIYNDQAVRQALTPLSKMLEATSCSCVLLAHVTKGRLGKHSHPLDAIGGSGGGLAGAARVVYVFGPNPDDEEERVLASAKENIMKPVSMSFDLDETDITLEDGLTTAPHLRLLNADAQITAKQVLRASEDDEGDSEGHAVKRAIAAEWLTSYLMFGERKAAEVREDAGKCGFSWSTVRRAAGLLDVQKARHGFGGEGYFVWKLPDGHPALKVGEQAAELADKMGVSFDPGTLTVEDVLGMIDAAGTVPDPGDA